MTEVFVAGVVLVIGGFIALKLSERAKRRAAREKGAPEHARRPKKKNRR